MTRGLVRARQWCFYFDTSFPSCRSLLPEATSDKIAVPFGPGVNPPRSSTSSPLDPLTGSSFILAILGKFASADLGVQSTAARPMRGFEAMVDESFNRPSALNAEEFGPGPAVISGRLKPELRAGRRHST